MTIAQDIKDMILKLPVEDLDSITWSVDFLVESDVLDNNEIELLKDFNMTTNEFNISKFLELWISNEILKKDIIKMLVEKCKEKKTFLLMDEGSAKYFSYESENVSKFGWSDFYTTMHTFLIIQEDVGYSAIMISDGAPA